MAYALIDYYRIIQNLIVYDGRTSYEPPMEFTLEQVPDTARIGDTFSNGVLTPPIGN